MANELHRCKEGDVFEPLNKKVEMLISSTDRAFVFLDQDLYVQWETSDEVAHSPEQSEILNQVSYLETISTTHFSGKGSEKNELAEFRRLLGECVSRAFEGNGSSARKLLAKCEALLAARSVQRARQWYLAAAALGALPAGISVVVLWVYRGYLRDALGPTGFDVATCAALGGIGALVSTIISVRRTSLNASFGATIHYFEGVARIVAGIVGGALTGLAIKGNLVLGSINYVAHTTGHSALLFLFALAAGASERIVPSFVKRAEVAADSHGSKAVGPTGDSQTD